MNKKIFPYIAVIGLAVIVAIFTIYQYSSSNLKLCNIKLENTISIAGTKNFTVENIAKNRKKVTCLLDTKYLKEQTYNNYVLGEDSGIKIDCNIIIQINSRTYTAKTFVEKVEENKIYFSSCIQSKYLENSYKVYVIDNQNNQIYEYVGGNSEINN